MKRGGGGVRQKVIFHDKGRGGFRQKVTLYDKGDWQVDKKCFFPSQSGNF